MLAEEMITEKGIEQYVYHFLIIATLIIMLNIYNFSSSRSPKYGSSRRRDRNNYRYVFFVFN